MSRALLPIDNLDKLEPALRFIEECERESRSPVEIHVLHVERPLPYEITSRLPARAVKSYHEDRSRQVLEAAAAALRQRNIPFKTHSVLGDPAECIVRVAAEAKANFIVLVSEDAGSTVRALAGGVTPRVLRHSTVPVEIVPVTPHSKKRAYAEAAGVGAAILTLLYLTLQ